MGYVETALSPVGSSAARQFLVGTRTALLHRTGFGARAETLAPTLLQLGVLCFRLFQHRNVRIGVFPQREEVLISRASAGIVLG